MHGTHWSVHCGSSGHGDQHDQYCVRSAEQWIHWFLPTDIHLPCPRVPRSPLSELPLPRGAEHLLSASLSHSMLFHLALCMDLIHRLLVLWLYIGCSQWGTPEEMRGKTDRGVYSTRVGMGWLHPSTEGPQKGQGAGNEGHSAFRISSRCISTFNLVHPYQCGPADHYP